MKVPNLCIQCKGGRALCGNERCPLLAKLDIKPKIEKLSKEFYGQSTSIFVGRFGYPRISVGPVGALEFNPDLENPNKWFGADYNEIIQMRSLTLRSKSVEHIKSKSRFVEENQLLAMAKPTDIELKFRKRPFFKMSFSDVTQPMGPSAPLERLKITENPKVPRKVEKIVGDELKSVEQCYSLYKMRVDIHKIMNILSSGALGLERNKKLVPTRFSITAIDDLIAKKLLEDIKNFTEIKEIQVFESEYLGNHFVILFMPGNWEFENFEAWAPGNFWAKDLKNVQVVEEYERHQGRTKYAEEQGGGYYSSRFSIIQYLHKIKRQARVVVFREISEKYIVPLGVWLVRLTIKHAFDKSPFKFNSLKEALDFINSKLQLSINNYLSNSKILRQKRLSDF